jgi:hypothetical protein
MQTGALCCFPEGICKFMPPGYVAGRLYSVALQPVCIEFISIMAKKAARMRHDALPLTGSPVMSFAIEFCISFR